MSKVLVIVGSITTAVRLEKMLKTINISSSVIHTPAEINAGGCSYSIKSDVDNLSYIKKIIQDNDIRVRGFYIENNFKGDKKYNAIS